MTDNIRPLFGEDNAPSATPTGPSFSPVVSPYIEIVGTGARLVFRCNNTDNTFRNAIEFANNNVGLFIGDDHGAQYFGFSAGGDSKNNNAVIQVHGTDASGAYGKHTDLYHDGTNGIVATSSGELALYPNTKIVKPYADNDIELGSATYRWKNIYVSGAIIGGALQDADGWNTTADTWVYASATTFTIAGVDRTTRFTPGTRLKLTQTTAKYFVVVSSAFSTNTTVTVTGGSDYTLANAAITSPYYSYQQSPAGYPTAFNWAPTYTGFSADPSNAVSYFWVIGKVCHIHHRETTNGTSNATGFTVSLPITAATITNDGAGFAAQATDNGTVLTTPAVGFILSAGTTLTLYKDWSGAAWTNSGAKGCSAINAEYRIA